MYIDSFWLIIGGLFVAYLLWRIHDLKAGISELADISDRLVQAQRFRVSRICNTLMLATSWCNLFKKAPKKLTEEYFDYLADSLYEDFKDSEIKFEFGEYKKIPNPGSYLPSLKDDFINSFCADNYMDYNLTEHHSKGAYVKMIKTELKSQIDF